MSPSQRRAPQDALRLLHLLQPVLLLCAYGFLEDRPDGAYAKAQRWADSSPTTTSLPLSSSSLNQSSASWPKAEATLPPTRSYPLSSAAFSPSLRVQTRRDEMRVHVEVMRMRCWMTWPSPSLACSHGRIRAKSNLVLPVHWTKAAAAPSASAHISEEKQ